MDASGAAVQQAIAAWVQAFGAIAAIGVAIWISSRQGKADRQQRIDEMRVRLGAIYKMLDQCAAQMTNLLVIANSVTAIAGVKNSSLEIWRL